MNKRLPVLDGWRGVAILFVLGDHFEYALFGERHSFLWGCGQHGVTVFFVLSGYLITSKLLERDIDLRSFYLRRFFRLMPVAWAYLISVAVIGVLMHHRILGHATASVFFFRNFIADGRGYTPHFWSLSVEEQFYFLWPLLLLIAGKRRAFWIAAAASLSCALYRFVSWSHYDAPGPNMMTQVRADAILVGCCLALLLSTRRGRDIMMNYSHWFLTPSLVVFAYCVVRFTWLPPLSESVAIAVLVAVSALRPSGGVISKVLSLKPLVWLGLISYSVYVWQQLFIQFRNPVVLIVVLGVSAASFHLIEKPTQRLGNRLASRMRSRAGHPIPEPSLV